MIKKNNSTLFISLLLLTTVFLLVEISFFIQCNQIYFSDFTIIASRIAIPAAIVPGIIFFIFAHVVLHLGYALGIWGLTVSSASAFQCSSSATVKWGLCLWSIGMMSIFISNQYLFPNSKFAELSRILFPESLLPYLFFGLCFFWAMILLVCAYVLFSLIRLRWSLLLVLAAASFLIDRGYQHYFYVSADASSEKRPNIILIGVDSLRPDFVEKLQAKYFNDFLSQATAFSNAFTPLARTYPSWMSILTGLFPKESGIRFNLARQTPEHMPPLLSGILKEQGYKTIYATDESQFSNIDGHYGFDETVIPTIGLNNFLLGTFNDFPLSNLLINTVVGKYFFPHSYANRPAFMTYDPDTFLTKLKPYLKKSRDRPLFLTVHFCLTHHPYLWRSHSGLIDERSLTRYQAAILRADQQVSHLMSMLQRYRILDHAIVVLLSDHGEALELPGDRITSPLTYVPLQEGKEKRIPRFYPPSADDEAINQSGGHGTDVLGFSQYRTVLAFRLFGLGRQALRSVPNKVLLLDIKPTLLDFLGVPDKSSGISLKKIILGQASIVPQRKKFFLETDFSPPAIRSVHPETRNLVFEGIEVFTIDPKTTRVFVKESMGNLIISSKQLAYVDGDWVLALYPHDQGKMTPVLVHLPSGRWTTDLRTAFAQHSPQERMLIALKTFYGKEIQHLI